jgi:20S proteasome subunit beta 3
MKGRNCVAIGMDRRLGAQYKTLSTNFQRVYKMTDKCLTGFIGLAGDIQTFSSYLKSRLNLYQLKEGRPMGSKTVAHLVTNTLYSKRFGPYFIEPIIAGLDENNEAYLATSDLIGCLTDSDNFFCVGPATELLLGVCESYYRPDLGPNELFEVVAQSLMAGVDRDAFSGWGAVVYLITPDGITAKTLQTRMD